MRRCVSILSLLALSACTKTLSEESAQKMIGGWLNDKIGIPVASVTCPKDRAVKANDTFECTAAVKSGGEVRVKVTQTDDQGNMKMELANTDNFMEVAGLEKYIAEWIKTRLKADATVTCGGGTYRISVPKASFVCTAKGSKGEEAPVTVTMKDAPGEFKLEINKGKQD